MRIPGLSHACVCDFITIFSVIIRLRFVTRTVTVKLVARLVYATTTRFRQLTDGLGPVPDTAWLTLTVLDYDLRSTYSRVYIPPLTTLHESCMHACL